MPRTDPLFPKNFVGGQTIDGIFLGPRSNIIARFEESKKCGQCGEEFLRQGDVRRHIESQHGERIFICPVGHARHPVPIVSASYDVMLQHLASGHDGNEEGKVASIDLTIDESGGLRPLPFHFSSLTVPFIGVSRHGKAALMKRELKHEGRDTAAVERKSSINFWLKLQHLSPEEQRAFRHEATAKELARATLER